MWGKEEGGEREEGEGDGPGVLFRLFFLEEEASATIASSFSWLLEKVGMI